MRDCDVQTPSQAVAYLVDCTMATVCDLAMKRSRPKREFSRQIKIAQKGVDWMKIMGISCEGTRVSKLNGMTVEEWAKQFYPDKK